MTIVTNQITLTDTPSLIVAATVAGAYVNILNRGSKTCFVDGANVTATNGYELRNNANMTVWIAPGEAIYGVCGTGDTTAVCFFASLVYSA